MPQSSPGSAGAVWHGRCMHGASLSPCNGLFQLSQTKKCRRCEVRLTLISIEILATVFEQPVRQRRANSEVHSPSPPSTLCVRCVSIFPQRKGVKKRADILHPSATRPSRSASDTRVRHSSCANNSNILWEREKWLERCGHNRKRGGTTFLAARSSVRRQC